MWYKTSYKGHADLVINVFETLIPGDRWTCKTDRIETPICEMFYALKDIEPSLEGELLIRVQSILGKYR